MKNKLLVNAIALNIFIFLLLVPFSSLAMEYIEGNNLIPYSDTNTVGKYSITIPVGLHSPLQLNHESIYLPNNNHHINFGFRAPREIMGGSDWSNSGGNAGRNGLSETTGPVAADLLWSGGPTSLISWLPVTEGNRLFVIRQAGWPGDDNDSLVYAMDLSNGEMLWTQEIPYHPNDWITWIAGVKNGHVYASRWNSGIGSPINDNLYCLDAVTGEILWISTDLINAGPYDGVVFAPDGDPVIGSHTDIWRFNSEDGLVVWHANRVGSVSHSCGGAIYGDAFYIADVTGGGHIIVKYNLDTGQLLYSSPVMPGFTLQNTPLVGPDGTIYLSRTQNNPSVDFFYAFTDTGTSFVEKWHIPCAWTTNSEFAVGPDGSVYCILPGPRIGKIDGNGNIVAQSELIGEPGYTYLAPHFAIDAKGTVYFSNGGFSDGRLTVFTPDLQPIWNVSIPNINIGGPALGAQGTLLVCGTGMNMRAYRAPQPSFNISVSGKGTKIKVALTNNGEKNATNIHWGITVTGGLFGRINTTTTGEIPVLSISETMNVATRKPIIGFGKISIAVHVTCDEEVSATKTATGFAFLIFIVGVS